MTSPGKNCKTTKVWTIMLGCVGMTKQIVEIADLLGISVHDHIIVGKNGHASLKGLRLI